MKKKTIAILGANSQVGTEVCLLLDHREDVTVVPVCRSAPATAFLERCGLRCRVGRLGSVDEARRLLEGCDAVAEFSRPWGGSARETRAATADLIRHAVEGAPAGARYVFMSTIMAFGMAQNSGARRPHRVSRTIYGQTKRHAEAVALRAGRQAGREVYLLRLGDVHGAIQNVGRLLLGRLRDERAHVPRSPSYAVFTHTVAEALAHIAGGLERPGLYTLVAEPAMSWRELHEHYCRLAGIEADVEEYTVPARAAQRFWRPLVQMSLEAARRRRETIAAYVLWRLPRLESRLRGVHVRSSAAQEIAAMRRARQWRPFEPTFVGRMPGQRLRSLSDGRAGIDAAYRAVQDALARARPTTPGV